MTKLAKLREILADHGSVLVAYSGGVDSAFVLRVAVDVLGDRALAVTGRSPAVPAREIEEAAALAGKLGARHRILNTAELSDPDYVANGPRRCYFCKSELFGKLEPVREAEGLAVIVDGANLDDRGDYRPGRVAGKERGVVSPLIEAGFDKDDVRSASRALGLPTAEKPASPCLASRFPYGTAVTADGLARVERAEESLRGLGFEEFRVRHLGDAARVEVAPAELDRLFTKEMSERVVSLVQKAGYEDVALDREGYRSGRLNEALAPTIRRSPSA